MKQHSTIFTVLILLVFLTAFALNAATDNEKKEVTLTGFITEAEWNDDDEVTAIALVVTMETEEGEEETVEYIVGKTEKGKELWGYIGEEAEVTGFIVMNKNNTTTINVTKYIIVQQVEEEDEEDE